MPTQQAQQSNTRPSISSALAWVNTTKASRFGNDDKVNRARARHPCATAMLLGEFYEDSSCWVNINILGREYEILLTGTIFRETSRRGEAVGGGCGNTRWILQPCI